MKNIFDLYEENATPANTTGMGNPIPASEECNGSEPLVGKKKAKCKKEKIDEASVLDIENTISQGSEYYIELYDFIKYLIDSYNQLKRVGKTLVFEEVVDDMIKTKVISKESNGTYAIDITNMEKLQENRILNHNFGWFFSDKKFPKFVKKIKFINTEDTLAAATGLNVLFDMKNIPFDIEVYENTTSLGYVNIFTNKDDVKFKDILCDTVKFKSPSLKSISATNISAEMFVADWCKRLENINVKFNNVVKIVLPESYLKNQFMKYGASENTVITIQ